MIYRRQIKIGRGRKILIAAAVAGFLLAALLFGARPFLAEIFTAIGIPIWSASRALPDNVSINLAFVSRGELTDKIRELEGLLRSAELKLAATGALLQENKELKILLGRSDSSRDTVAAVLARPPETLYDTFILDIGERSGVSAGNLVIAEGRYPIGEIAEVSADYAKARLFSSPGNKIKVLLGDEKNETVAIGMGGYYIAEVPQEFPVSEGDSVLLPGIDLQIYGFVATVELRPASPFKYVYFASPINFNKLRFVTVRKSSDLRNLFINL